jgi:hypothetical protein
MDAGRFDTLTRSLTDAHSRRRALSGLLAGALGLLVVQSEEAQAHNPLKACKKKSGDKKKKCVKKAKKHNAAHAATVPPANPCVANCVGKTCGSNGCGGVCGTCPTGDTCNGRHCVGFATCGIGHEVCSATADAGCCVAGQNCCAPGTGENGCCGEDYDCLSPNATYPEGRCDPICDDPDFPVPCTNDFGCCPSTDPVCCPEWCCPSGTHCGDDLDSNACLAGSSSVQEQVQAQGTAATPKWRRGHDLTSPRTKTEHY